MKTITVSVPESVNEFHLKMSVAGILYDKGLLTSGQAAKFAGISKREFIEKIGSYGISIFGETVEDLKAGIDL